MQLTIKNFEAVFQKKLNYVTTHEKVFYAEYHDSFIKPKGAREFFYHLVSLNILMTFISKRIGLAPTILHLYDEILTLQLL